MWREFGLLATELPLISFYRVLMIFVSKQNSVDFIIFFSEYNLWLIYLLELVICSKYFHGLSKPLYSSFPHSEQKRTDQAFALSKIWFEFSWKRLLYLVFFSSSFSLIKLRIIISGQNSELQKPIKRGNLRSIPKIRFSPTLISNIAKPRICWVDS